MGRRKNGLSEQWYAPIITLPNPTQDILKKVNKLIFTFIWNSPVHRVKNFSVLVSYMYSNIV